MYTRVVTAARGAAGILSGNMQAVANASAANSNSVTPIPIANGDVAKVESQSRMSDNFVEQPSRLAQMWRGSLYFFYYGRLFGLSTVAFIAELRVKLLCWLFFFVAIAIQVVMLGCQIRNAIDHPIRESGVSEQIFRMILLANPILAIATLLWMRICEGNLIAFMEAFHRYSLIGKQYVFIRPLKWVCFALLIITVLASVVFTSVFVADISTTYNESSGVAIELFNTSTYSLIFAGFASFSSVSTVFWGVGLVQIMSFVVFVGARSLNTDINMSLETTSRIMLVFRHKHVALSMAVQMMNRVCSAYLTMFITAMIAFVATLAGLMLSSGEQMPATVTAWTGLYACLVLVAFVGPIRANGEMDETMSIVVERDCHKSLADGAVAGAHMLLPKETIDYRYHTKTFLFQLQATSPRLHLGNMVRISKGVFILLVAVAAFCCLLMVKISRTEPCGLSDRPTGFFRKGH